VRVFDRKFGADFLAGVPSAPGVYRLYDAVGALLYVGKAGDLRRRLAQYRTTRRTKKDRKRRALVGAAAGIAWDVCASELEAALREVQLIQSLRPPANVAGAFPFLYPFIGIRAADREISFCLTTSPGAFPEFDLHGAFRSREVTGEAFFALTRLFGIVGHPVSGRQRARVAHSYHFGFRRLPSDWPALWGRLLRGTTRDALEDLSLRLLDHASARARRAQVEEDLRAISRLYDDEARILAEAIAATGYARYPVPQLDRDALVLEYRRRGPVAIQAAGT
jgi:excinuclease ABC subunit C